MKISEFYSNILRLLDNKPTRSLEEYLLALHGLLEHRNSDHLDCDRLLKYLSEAFYSEPAALQDSWKLITSVPSIHRIQDSLVSAEEQWNYSLTVLRFQIAELHAMRGKQLEDEYRYFGVDSETGHRWYNFDPFTNLECGARAIFDGSDEGEEVLEIDPSFIGEFFEMGRLYE